MGERGHKEGPPLPRDGRQDVKHHRHQLRHGELLGALQSHLEAQGRRHGARRQGALHAGDAGAAGEGGAGVHEARHREDVVHELNAFRGTFLIPLTPFFRDHHD